MPNDPAADNSIAINAALADPEVFGVILPGGDIRVDHAVVVPTGKFVRGSGRGVTRLVRTNNVAGADYFDKALIRSVDNADGVRVSDLSVVSPKVNDKVQGVWMRGARNFVVENVEALNCGYAFWAQEFARFGVFRNIISRNANVHFETTQATDILFENMDSSDGDGDNPLGVEAVWHTLFGSKRITFRHGRHTGKGTPYLVIADAGAGNAGLIDEILFDDCDAVNTDGKLILFMNKITATASINRVMLKDCNVVGGNVGPSASLLGLIYLGNAVIQGGRGVCFSQQVYSVGAGASLKALNHEVEVNSPAAAYGAVYSGSVQVIGGSITINAPLVATAVGGPITITGTYIKHVAGLYLPGGIGELVQYTYPIDLPITNGGNQVVGAGNGQPRPQFTLTNGNTYRIRFRGKMRKGAGAYPAMSLLFEGTGGTITSGSIAFEKDDGTIESFAPAVNGAYVGAGLGSVPANATRNFFLDVTIKGNGSQLALNQGSSPNTILAGAVLSIERIL
ncbi:hypothetical protein C7I55_15490 [Sphingomonas deserti]|uniref:Right handed beta helix domain-containing protein n=1 Tax=Allosphingosinicella deserti TaxID=2116704 RepID=A0A2P7QPR8_9SPHN|nr:hypothetical protein C7I55_15490 [Sphingomonas deserti]